VSNQTRVINPIYSFFPTEIEGFDKLAELALDMRWSWNHFADELWRQLDPDLWESTHNPWVVLQTISRDQLQRVLSDPVFRNEVEQLLQAKRDSAESPAWFQKTHVRAPITGVAYFSMEFMLSEALPIYSGGLGNVAGDQLKAAGDLGIPVIGIGLLYQQGYFRQVITKDGVQQALFPYNDPGQLPITPVREPNGEWLRLQIALPGYTLWLRAWQVQVGRVKAFLLDSNDAANLPAHRGITSELYGGGPELRLKQELVLGIGGWRLLGALNIHPEVCHLNEGHAAFAVLERAHGFMQATQQPFEVALAATRAGNLFTTHTAVAAGFDRFTPSLMTQYLAGYAREQLGITLNELLALGRQNPNDANEDFNMAYLAIRGSGAVNAVSRLHGKVSRQLFQSLFPRRPLDEVPVEYITNGVHVPTWDSAESDDLFTQSCGKGCWIEGDEALEHGIHKLSDDRIWRMRSACRRSLIDYTRRRLTQQFVASGAHADDVDRARDLFDPDALTMGFARRFATYKRPNLLLHDHQRLLRLLTDHRRPVQLIIAGKAHPADEPGKAMIREWMQFIRGTPARNHVVFLSDYDMLLTEHLVQGVDVWINTPRRPWEACGTSGMKVLVNGGLNLSELDGWWAEAYSDDVGWALGDGRDRGDDPAWDAVEAESLYDLLEYEVIPEFYARDASGIPSAWVARMRESMARLTPRFSANRTVREYTEKHYIPAATAFRRRAEHNGALARRIVQWQHEWAQNWEKLRFGDLHVKTVKAAYEFEVRIFVGGIDPEGLRVELYAEGQNGNDPVRQEMILIRELSDDAGEFVYHATVPAIRPPEDYTPRMMPCRDEIAVPLENPLILWQR
jgi:glycogen phosphorylase